MKKRIKSKVTLTLIMTCVLTTVIGLTYGVFMITTGKYNATNMLISNLMYKIDIKSTGGSETINGKTVNLSGGNTSTVLVKIESLNPIDTNYQLEYKITEGEGTISYASNTGWKPSGNLSKSNGLVYVKTVKVVIEATTNLTVDFNVSGGYTHDNNIIALEGYNKITNEYDKIYNYTEESNLKDIIEKETNCESTPCLYGGETVNNYLQYPSSTNLSENIWRITGIQDLEDYIALKLIGNIRSTTNVSGISDSLSNIYTALEKKEDYIYLTNKFNCNETGCNTSNYENIGLLTTYEYNKIGGLNSYLANSNNFYSLSETTIENITPSGVEETSDATTSGIRPVIYLQSDVNVTGSGTARDPYRLSSKGDIIMASATLNGGSFPNKPEGYFPSEEDPYIVSSVSCTNGTEGKWDEEKKTIILTTPNLPTTCTVDFSEGYTIEMYGEGATIGDPASQVVGRIGETSFNFTADTGYIQSIASVTCDNGATGVIEGNTVNITNIKKSGKCTLTLSREKYAVCIIGTSLSENICSEEVEYGGSADITFSLSDGYSLENSYVICDNASGSLNGNTLNVIDVTGNTLCTINSELNSYDITLISKQGEDTFQEVKNVFHGGDVLVDLSSYSGPYLSKNPDIECSGSANISINGNLLTLGNIIEEQTCTIVFKAPTLANTILDAYGIPTNGRPSFSAIDNGTPALYKGIDDQGTTYYFSGDGSTMNNWVSFAGSKWRIIRINGNGSVRLLYAGDGNTGSASNNYNGVGSSSGKSAFNSTYNHPQYVGWKYTAGNSLSTNRRNGTPSTIYNSVNTWYTGLSAENKNYIDPNAIYCNDRNENGTYSTSSEFYYGAYQRLAATKGTPIFTCNESDQFKDGFGLMTADEVVAAGGLWVTKSPKAYYYLNAAGNGSITGDQWWRTMSPSYWNGSHAIVFFVGGSGSYPGQLGNNNVNNSYVVRPVVSLKSNVLVTGGSGTGSDPYVVQGLQ